MYDETLLICDDTVSRCKQLSKYQTIRSMRKKESWMKAKKREWDFRFTSRLYGHMRTCAPNTVWQHKCVHLSNQDSYGLGHRTPSVDDFHNRQFEIAFVGFLQLAFVAWPDASLLSVCSVFEFTFFFIVRRRERIRGRRRQSFSFSWEILYERSLSFCLLVDIPSSASPILLDSN